MHKDTSRRAILQTGIAASAAAAIPGSAFSGEKSMTSDKKTLFKVVYLVKRKPGMTWDDYVKAQFEHTKFAHALPGLRHYMLDFFPPVDGVDQPYDTAASVFFDDEAGRNAALSSKEGEAALGDLQRFLEMEAIVVLSGYEEMDLPFPST